MGPSTGPSAGPGGGGSTGGGGRGSGGISTSPRGGPPNRASLLDSGEVKMLSISDTGGTVRLVGLNISPGGCANAPASNPAAGVGLVGAGASTTGWQCGQRT